MLRFSDEDFANRPYFRRIFLNYSKPGGNMSMVDSFEKIPVKIFKSLEEGSQFAAKEVAKLIREKESKGEKCVLGLATGSSPKTFYAELVRMHQHEKLSFKNVIAFNLDQYYPINNDAIQSYRRFMRKQLFDKVDIDPKNCHIPSGEWKEISEELHRV
jgi:glucosamine-6-phosphate deaminase